MNKCIILSVKSEWLVKILNGEKTIEIRKSLPKCDYPIDVYLYCTKPNKSPNTSNGNKTQILTLDESTNKYRLWRSSYGEVLNGKIVAKFKLNKAERFDVPYPAYFNEVKERLQHIVDGSCLNFMDLHHYLGVSSGYAWHIDNLQIFDKPMELNQFWKNNFDEDNAKPCNCSKYCEFQDYDYVENQPCCGIDYDGSSCPFLKVQRPSPSWCYAYKEE